MQLIKQTVKESVSKFTETLILMRTSPHNTVEMFPQPSIVT